MLFHNVMLLFSSVWIFSVLIHFALGGICSGVICSYDQFAETTQHLSSNVLMQSFNLINLSTMFCGISDIGLFVPA